MSFNCNAVFLYFCTVRKNQPLEFPQFIFLRVGAAYDLMYLWQLKVSVWVVDRFMNTQLRARLAFDKVASSQNIKY